jgi:hypothetical protein
VTKSLVLSLKDWRKAALLGAAVAVAGLSLLSAAPAKAALGTQPGTLTLTPATGPLSTVPTWSTTTACPSTANASAKLLLLNPDGVTLTAFSANINGASTPLTNEPTVAGASVRVLETNAGYTAGKTGELVVQCYSGASGTGTIVRYMHARLTFNTDNTTYTVSALSSPVAPTSTDSPTSTSTAAAGTPNGAPRTGGGPAPGSDVPMAVGGIALLLVGGGLVLSRWRTAAGSLARRRRATGKPES